MPTGVAPSFAVAFLNYLFNGTAMPAAPSAWYVQMHVGDPGPAGTANLAVETDRVAASFATATTITVATDAVLALTSVAASEDYSHFTVWTALTGGTFIASGLVTSSPVIAGQDWSIDVGGLTFTVPGVAA